MRTQRQSDESENPYATTATAYIGNSKQPLLVSILRGSYILLWLVALGTSLTRNLGFVTIAENKSMYDGLWMLGALANLGILLYMFHYTLSRLLLAHILLWGMYATFTFLMVIGIHDVLPPRQLFLASNFLWPIVVWRLRARNPSHRFMLRATATISMAYLLTYAVPDLSAQSPVIAMILILAYGLNVLARTVVLTPYCFPDLYPENKR